MRHQGEGAGSGPRSDSNQESGPVCLVRGQPSPWCASEVQFFPKHRPLEGGKYETQHLEEIFLGLKPGKYFLPYFSSDLEISILSLAA